MKILLLSNHASLHILLQHLLMDRASGTEVWRTHTLASALPYLRQVPELEAVVLDIALCGWSRLATLVTTLRPCLDGRKLVLLIEQPDDAELVRLCGVSVDHVLPKTAGVNALVECLQGYTPDRAVPAARHARVGSSQAGSALRFNQLAW
jgi:DNA-binding NarL/FixJ family response regulator